MIQAKISPKGGISIGVRAARQRDHGGELGIAQTSEGAAKARKDEGEHQARSRVVRAQAGHHENPGANDGSHSERGELKHAESTLEAVFAAFAGFRQKHAQWFTNE